jgi:hypothetical protein
VRRTWTIIGVGDVPNSFKWYQSLFGLPETAPAHEDFGQILDSDQTVLLCLHEWGAHEHSSLTSPNHAQPGNGLFLFFRVVLTPRSGRVLRDDQCALCGLTTCSTGPLAGGASGRACRVPFNSGVRRLP